MPIRTLLTALLLSGLCVAQTPTNDVLKQAAVEMVESRRVFTQQMIDSIFRFSELGYQEFETSAYITQILEKEGLLCPKMVKSFDFRTAKNVVTDTPQMVTVRGTGLWTLRPFSRIVFGWKAYVIVKNYIQLNEKEALGQIKYSKYRLRGLSASDWNILWT